MKLHANSKRQKFDEPSSRVRRCIQLLGLSTCEERIPDDSYDDVVG